LDVRFLLFFPFPFSFSLGLFPFHFFSGVFLYFFGLRCGKACVESGNFPAYSSPFIDVRCEMLDVRCQISDFRFQMPAVGFSSNDLILTCAHSPIEFSDCRAGKQHQLKRFPAKGNPSEEN